MLPKVTSRSKSAQRAPVVNRANTGDNTDVADIDSEKGELILHKFGTANITAKFEGNDNYLPSSATYTLNYQAYHTEEFDFSKPQDYGYNVGSTLDDGDKIESGIWTSHVSGGSYASKTNCATAIRLYPQFNQRNPYLYGFWKYEGMVIRPVVNL